DRQDQHRLRESVQGQVRHRPGPVRHAGVHGNNRFGGRDEALGKRHRQGLAQEGPRSDQGPRDAARSVQLHAGARRQAAGLRDDREGRSVRPVQLTCLAVAEQLYNAIFVGSIYALFAVGFALVFSVLDILNLAHPVVFMLDAFVALFCMSTFGLPAALAAVAAFLVTGLFGIFLDRVAFAPLRRRGAPPLSAMISSLGFAIVVIRLMELRYGPDLTSYPAGSLPQTVVQIGDARVDGLRLLIIGLAILLMAALTYVVRATSLGRDIRALAENPRAARILGVDVERAIAATFFISSGLGGLAGVLLGFAYDSVDSKMGLPLELRAFTVMVVGGMGSLPRAVLGAYILGLGEVASLVYLPAELRDAFAFGLLFIVLVLRPSGLLGQRTADRV